MTRAWSLVWAVSAALAIAAAAIAQATDSGPLIPTTTTAPYGAEIARETSCGTLRIRWTQELSVWKGGVKDHHRAEVQPHLEAMVAILERIAWLEERGRCGG